MVALDVMESFRTLVDEKFRNNALGTLMQYVSIPSLSPAFDAEWEASGAIEGAMELLARWAQSREIPGLSVEISRLEGRTPAMVIEVAPSAASSETVLIYGHLDKQPATAPWLHGSDPFLARRDGDKIFGRGVVDDGYAIFAALSAIEALAATASPYPRCVVLIEASEESGSPDLNAHLDALEAQLGDVALVVCLDSGGLDFERLWITTSLRGNLVLTIDVAVLDHGVHSGEAGGVVPSSFRILRQLLSRIEDQTTGEVIVPELSAEIPELYRRHATNLATELNDPLSRAFPLVGGLKLLGADATERILNQTWRPALALTGIEGIPDTASGGNVLRAGTKAKISVRLPPSVDALQANAVLEDLLGADPPHGASVTVASESPAQGWVAPPLSPWLEEALTLASMDGFGKAPGFCGEGGSIPFLAALTERFPHADFVATGALGPSSNAHGPDESLSISTAVGVSVALAHLIQAASSHP